MSMFHKLQREGAACESAPPPQEILILLRIKPVEQDLREWSLSERGGKDEALEEADKDVFLLASWHLSLLK